MDQDTQRRSQAPDLGTIEGTDASAPLAPVLVRSAAHLRSPILEQRSAAPAPPPADPDRPGLDIPAVPVILRAVGWALLPAIPVLLLVGWLPAVVLGVVALGAREMRHASFGFGDGFLPFRAQDGWPRGVQEEDDVHWDWSPLRDGHGARG
jgi:hypothetical protein